MNRSCADVSHPPFSSVQMLRISAIPKLPDEPDICVQPQPQPQPQKREGKETKDAASHKTVLERLNEKLEEDRHHINYEKYTTCAAHKARYKTLPQELHIPRYAWFFFCVHHTPL
jgi:hypothetical protein